MAIPALLVAPIISGVKSLFGYWMKTKEEKAEIRKLKVEGEIRKTEAKIESDIQQINNKYQMDAAAVGDMRYTWKDEFLVILLSIPVIMCFIPGLAPYVTKGFEVLKSTPEWYQYAFLGIVAATFGLRAWFNGFKK